MPYFERLNRERTRVRGRTRPLAFGNFLTVTKGSIVYYLLYGKTEREVPYYALYAVAFPKLFGYIEEVPPEPRLKPLGVISNAQLMVPTTIDVTGPPIQLEIPTIPQVNPFPQILPTETAPTAPSASVGLKAGDAGKLPVGLSPKRIFETTFPIKQVLILAASANTGTIWVKPSPFVSAENGFPLIAGAARLWPIDDLSVLYYVGEDAADAIYFAYER